MVFKVLFSFHSILFQQMLFVSSFKFEYKKVNYLRQLYDRWSL